MSEVVAHWEDVEPYTITRAPLAGRRWRLGPPAGTDRTGLSRYAMGPGERPMPLHTHADEEEIVFVLAGSGVTTDGERAWAIGSGDTVVHPAGGAPHAFVAGDEGMDVLVFASGSDTRLTYLPRTDVMWLGPRWLPLDGPNPMRAEAGAGPLVLPPVEAERPPHVVALDAVEVILQAVSDVRCHRRRTGRAAGSSRSGLTHSVIEPGRRSSFPHHHSGEEELYVVLEGSGALELHEQDATLRSSHPVGPGALIARPAGRHVAHSFVGGPDGLTLLAYSRDDASDMCFYPRSQNVALRGLGVTFAIERLARGHGEPEPTGAAGS